MLGKLKALTAHPLFKGSAVMFIASMVVNFSNYVYTVLMGRLLGPVHYGTLAALISLLYIVAVPSQTLNTVTVKFISKFHALKKGFEIWNFFVKSTKKLTLLSLPFLLLSVYFRAEIASYLKIERDYLIILLLVVILVTFLNSINRGVLQGIQEFNFLAGVSVVSVLVKLFLGTALVLLGFSVGGAMWGLILGILAAYFLSIVRFKKFRSFEEEARSATQREVINYALPTLFAFFGLTLIINQDVVLVKRFFSPEEAGFYSALALIGKMIYFASSSVVMVMFPIISEKFTSQENYSKVLRMSFLLITAIVAGSLAVYFLFPSLVVNLVFGSSYSPIIPLVGKMGVALGLYSLSYALLLFFLSVQKTFSAVLPIVVAILHLILLLFYHMSLAQVVDVSIISNVALLAALLLYYTGLKLKGNI